MKVAQMAVISWRNGGAGWKWGRGEIMGVFGDMFEGNGGKGR